MSIIKGGVRVQCLEKQIKLIAQTRLVNAWETELSYEQALAKSDLCLLSTRRQVITDRLFQSIIKDNNHKLKKVLPDICIYNFNLRRQRKFKLVFKTNRFRDSFIRHNSVKEAQKRTFLRL